MSTSESLAGLGSKQTHPIIIHTLASSTSVQLRANVNETDICTTLWSHLCRVAQKNSLPFLSAHSATSTYMFSTV